MSVEQLIDKLSNFPAKARVLLAILEEEKDVGRVEQRDNGEISIYSDEPRDSLGIWVNRFERE